MKNRKFTLAISLSAVFCLMFVFGKLDQTGFITLIEWTLAGYLGANVGHRAVEVLAAKEVKDVSVQ